MNMIIAQRLPFLFHLHLSHLPVKPYMKGNRRNSESYHKCHPHTLHSQSGRESEKYTQWQRHADIGKHGYPHRYAHVLYAA